MRLIRSAACLVLGLSVAACASAVPLASPEVVARGAGVYETNCRFCHGDAQGEGHRTSVPLLGGKGHAYLHSDADLRYIVEHGSDALLAQIRQAQKLPPDLPLMPAFAGTLSLDDVQSVIAYMKSLWSDDQRRFQQTVPSTIKQAQP